MEDDADDDAVVLWKSDDAGCDVNAEVDNTIPSVVAVTRPFIVLLDMLIEYGLLA